MKEGGQRCLPLAGVAPMLLPTLPITRCGARSALMAQDAYWAQHENPKGRKDAKREEEVRRGERPARRPQGLQP